MEAADVRSIEALQDMHAATVKFRAEAIDALAACELTVRRAHDWLSDQVTFWRAAIRATEEEVFQAKQELAQRKYVGYDGREPDTSVQVQNLKRAQAKLAHAERKLEAVRGWQRKLSHAVSETYDGPARQLSAILEADLPRGLALLERRLAALEAYLNIAPVGPQLEVPPAEAQPSPTPAAEARK